MHMLWFLTAKTLLSDSHIMSFSRQMLVAIMDQPQCLAVAEVSGSGRGGRRREGRGGEGGGREGFTWTEYAGTTSTMANSLECAVWCLLFRSDI